MSDTWLFKKDFLLFGSFVEGRGRRGSRMGPAVELFFKIPFASLFNLSPGSKCIRERIWRAVCVSLLRKKTRNEEWKKRFEMQIRLGPLILLFVDVFLAKRRIDRVRRLKKGFHVREEEGKARWASSCVSSGSFYSRDTRKKGKAINFSSFIRNACITRHTQFEVKPRPTTAKRRNNEKKV